jgi:hypothetical protein
MKSSDIGLTLLIFIIFIALYASNLLAIGIQNIKNNWSKYRCNPMVIPLSKTLSPDGISASDNFIHCVQNVQKNYMTKLLQPVNFNLNLSATILGSITETIDSFRAFFDKIKNLMRDIFGNIFSVFLNLIIEVQRVTINIKDLFGKVVAIMGTMMYILSGSIMTMESAWKGPPGGLVRTVSKIKIRCFDPDTLIKTINNDYVKMSELKLGDRLKDGGEIVGTMQINNLDENGNPIDPYYVLKNGENNECIYVSGTHLIYNPYTMEFEMVSENENAVKTSRYGNFFTCLITSNHIIPIGKHVFHDWEDNNGSRSKRV